MIVVSPGQDNNLKVVTAELPGHIRRNCWHRSAQNRITPRKRLCGFLRQLAVHYAPFFFCSCFNVCLFSGMLLGEFLTKSWRFCIIYALTHLCPRRGATKSCLKHCLRCSRLRKKRQGFLAGETRVRYRSLYIYFDYSDEYVSSLFAYAICILNVIFEIFE